MSLNLTDRRKQPIKPSLIKRLLSPITDLYETFGFMWFADGLCWLFLAAVFWVYIISPILAFFNLLSP